MPTITTSLHHKYQPKLDALWACREIGSNGIDGEERHRYLGTGTLSITYSKRSKTLTVRNDGITVPATALLMGTSDSREEEDCIGEFGEGLPMALLVLARSDIPVTIFNGDEKWEPLILRSEQYGNEPVLAVKTRKMLKDRGGFEVQIKGIEPEEYEEFCSLFLRFDKGFDPQQAIAKAPHSKERVLLQARYHGRIYNKGVFVAEREDLMFGYDLHGELNRDRSMMDEWSLKRKLGQLLDITIDNNDEDFTDLIASTMFEEDGVLELSNEYSDLYYNDRLKTKIVECFVAKYGDTALAVEYDHEIEEAEALGFRGVLCSPLVGRMVRSRLGSVDDLKAKHKKSITQTWSDNQLTAAEQHSFRTAKMMVQSVMPAARTLNYEVVSFATDEMRFLFDEGAQSIQLSHSHLLDFETTLISTVKGAIGATSDLRDTSEVLATLIAQLIQGKGSTALALMLLGQAA